MSTAQSPDLPTEPEPDNSVRSRHAQTWRQGDSSLISPFRTRAGCFVHSLNWRVGIRWWSTSTEVGSVRREPDWFAELFALVERAEVAYTALVPVSVERPALQGGIRWPV